MANLDEARIDRAVLAVLSLTLHNGDRAWKTFDWDAMNRLHAKGFISDPVGTAKSVALTETGLAEAQRLALYLFGKEQRDMPVASVRAFLL
ncbi:MAG: hypothetical protein H7332_03735 [Bdellovibrionales bacterium]|nr:hypothetical protein [Ramlibacter sp.]